MMYARRDQENLIHGRQTAAIGKPLDQGIKAALAPKTPGAKTQTPAAPRNRAPLGAKTSNAKANAFKTPAPLAGAAGLQKTQRRSASARKPKLKIQSDSADVDPVSNDGDGGEPDIEYCPPKVIGLPDFSDDEELFAEGVTFPHLQGANILQGWDDQYNNEIGEDGLTPPERGRKQRLDFLDTYGNDILSEMTSQSIQLGHKNKADSAPIRAARSDKLSHGPVAHSNMDPQKHPAPKAAPSTLNAQSAASALSARPVPSFAAPTVSAKAKQTSSLEPVKRMPANAASRSTIGYAKGRKVSSSLRQLKGSLAVPPAGPPKKSQGQGDEVVDTKEQRDLIRQLTRRAEEDEEEGISPLFEKDDPLANWFEQRLGNFRLTLPELDEEGDA